MSADSRARGLLSATLFGLTVTAGTTLMNLARSKVSAEVLGPAGFGVAAMANQWVQLFTVVGAVVTGPALITTLAKKPSASIERRVLGFASLTVLMVNVVALGLALGAEHVLEGRTQVPALLIVLSTVGTTLSTLSQVPQARLIALNQLAKLTRLSLASTALNTIFVVGGTVLGGLEGQFAGAALGAGAGMLIFRVFAVPSFHETAAPREHGFEFLRLALGLGVTSLIAGFAVQFALTAIRVSIDESSGATIGGLFQAAWGLNTVVFTAITGGLGNFAFPRFSAAKSAESLGLEVSHTLSFVLRLAVPAAFVSLALQDLVVPLLFSDRFAGASSLIALLICGDVFRAGSWVMSGPLMYRGRVRAFLTLELLGALALGGVAPFLFVRFGLDGIGWAYCGNALLQLLASSVLLRRTESIRLPLRQLGLTLGSGSAALVGLWLLSSWPATRWLLLTSGLVLVGREAWSLWRNRRRPDGSAVQPEVSP